MDMDSYISLRFGLDTLFPKYFAGIMDLNIARRSSCVRSCNDLYFALVLARSICDLFHDGFITHARQSLETESGSGNYFCIHI